MAANNVSTRKGKSFFAKLMERREAMLALIVVAMYIVLSFITPSFMTWSNQKVVISSMAVDGIVVIGMTISLISEVSIFL